VKCRPGATRNGAQTNGMGKPRSTALTSKIHRWLSTALRKHQACERDERPDIGVGKLVQSKPRYAVPIRGDPCQERHGVVERDGLARCRVDRVRRQRRLEGCYHGHRRDLQCRRGRRFESGLELKRRFPMVGLRLVMCEPFSHEPRSSARSCESAAARSPDLANASARMNAFLLMSYWVESIVQKPGATAGSTCSSAAGDVRKREARPSAPVSSNGEVYRVLREVRRSFPDAFLRGAAGLACAKMAMQDPLMDISVTQFRASCLELIRRVETGGEPVDIKRRGKVVARLAPPPAAADVPRKPWKRLRGSGELLAEPGESVLDERELEASR
jgi:antitoxin (DNA-binding transcriptional repressor) of toxin-antitoxin stability system